MHTRGGRPKIFKGCKAEHLRIRFHRLGKKRAFFARWRRELALFEFQLSGYGMQPYKFFGPSKGLVLANLRLRSSVSPVDGWRWEIISDDDWQGGDDPVGKWITADTPAGPPPAFRTLPAASKDRVNQAMAFFA